MIVAIDDENVYMYHDEVYQPSVDVMKKDQLLKRLHNIREKAFHKMEEKPCASTKIDYAYADVLVGKAEKLPKYVWVFSY